MSHDGLIEELFSDKAQTHPFGDHFNENEFSTAPPSLFSSAFAKRTRINVEIPNITQGRRICSKL
jgi:hypothetical protein